VAVVTGLSCLIDLGSPTVVTSENLDSSSCACVVVVVVVVVGLTSLSVISVTEILTESSDVAVVESNSLSVHVPCVVVVVVVVVVVDVVVVVVVVGEDDMLDVTGSLCWVTGGVSTAKVVVSMTGTLVWVEVETIENFSALETVVNT